MLSIYSRCQWVQHSIDLNNTREQKHKKINLIIISEKTFLALNFIADSYFKQKSRVNPKAARLVKKNDMIYLVLILFEISTPTIITGHGYKFLQLHFPSNLTNYIQRSDKLTTISRRFCPISCKTAHVWKKHSMQYAISYRCTGKDYTRHLFILVV